VDNFVRGKLQVLQYLLEGHQLKEAFFNNKKHYSHTKKQL